MDLLPFVAVPAAAYLLVAVLVALDAMAPALPAEVVVVSAGAFAAAGHLDLAWAIAAAAAGALAGDLAVYGLGRRRLPAALDRSRLGRRVRAIIDRTHDRMGSASGAAIVAGRFIPLGRTTVAAAAGLAGVRPRRFVVLALLGGMLWAAWTVGLGFVTGSVTDAPLWLQVALGTAVGVAVGIWAGTMHTIARTRRRMSNRARLSVAADTAAEPTPEPELVA